MPCLHHPPITPSCIAGLLCPACIVSPLHLTYLIDCLFKRGIYCLDDLLVTLILS